ncbi:MAG: hydroxymethylglutaryl-CoA reductase, degradative [Planctomycetota bacterium]|nr:MAG: hydroxymethylglutaryl-CoA reductase, degradative [Planctomycetota bacterium]
MKNSRMKGFYQLSVKDRLERVAHFAQLDEEEKEILYSHKNFHVHQADKMIENVAGIFPLPLGFAANFRINNKDYIVPMVIEEASVVAAASNAARYLRSGRGIEAECSSSIMIGQVQLLDVPDFWKARRMIFTKEEEILRRGNDPSSMIVRKGGGLKRVEVRIFEEEPAFMVVHLYVDVLDAMGANAVNTICERLAPYLEELTGGKAHLKILSNLCEQRTVKVKGTIHLGHLHPDRKEAERIALAVEQASIFAERDPYRAVTHNKGIMNGIDAVLLATGQDWRAVEAAAHAFAARKGEYTALATWRYRKKQGVLEGRMEIPMSIGTVGGITKVHPTVRVCLKVLDVHSAKELACVVAAVGLAQNFAAIKALGTEGIQKGHMALHSRNLAVAAGAKEDEVEEVARRLVASGVVQAYRAQEILYELRLEKSYALAEKVGAQGNEVQEVAHGLLAKGIFRIGKAKEILQSIRGNINGSHISKSRI